MCVVFSSLTKHNGSEKKFLKLNPHRITSHRFRLLAKCLKLFRSIYVSTKNRTFGENYFRNLMKLKPLCWETPYSISNLLICEANANYLFYDQFHSLAKKKYNNSKWSETPKNFVNNDWRMENKSKPKKSDVMLLDLYKDIKDLLKTLVQFHPKRRFLRWSL